MDKIAQLLVTKYGVHPAVARSFAAKVLLSKDPQAEAVKAEAGLPVSITHPMSQMLMTKYGVPASNVPVVAQALNNSMFGGVGQAPIAQQPQMQLDVGQVQMVPQQQLTVSPVRMASPMQLDVGPVQMLAPPAQTTFPLPGELSKYDGSAGRKR